MLFQSKHSKTAKMRSDFCWLVVNWENTILRSVLLSFCKLPSSANDNNYQHVKQTKSWVFENKMLITLEPFAATTVFFPSS